MTERDPMTGFYTYELKDALIVVNELAELHKKLNMCWIKGEVKLMTESDQVATIWYDLECDDWQVQLDRVAATEKE